MLKIIWKLALSYSTSNLCDLRVFWKVTKQNYLIIYDNIPSPFDFEEHESVE